MSKTKTVAEYLRDLRESRRSKPPQVREALDVYIELWEGAIKEGVVDKEDDIDSAVARVDAGGGLYRVAETDEVSA